MAAAILPLLAASFAPATARTIEPGRDLYPAEEAAAGIEGDVPVSLHVDPAGGLRCVAHGEAAVAPLKRGSCRLIADRDVFLPATGTDSRTTDNNFELTIRWRLKADESQFGGAVPIGRPWWVRHLDEPFGLMQLFFGGRVRVAFDITEYGHVENCSVAKTSYSLALGSLVCPLLLKRAAFLPAIGSDGRPRRTRGWFAVHWLPVPLGRDFSADADS